MTKREKELMKATAQVFVGGLMLLSALFWTGIIILIAIAIILVLV